MVAVQITEFWSFRPGLFDGVPIQDVSAVGRFGLISRGPGFETYRRRVVSLSKTLYSPKVLVNYPGSDGSVPI